MGQGTVHEQAVQLSRRWRRPELAELSGYQTTAVSPGMIRLDAMENPHSWPEALRRSWAEDLLQVRINRYPDPEARELKSRLATNLGVPAGQELLLGNGSDELIQLVCLALAGPSRALLLPSPTFTMYGLVARWTGLELVEIPLTEDFGLDLPALIDAIGQRAPALLFLARPNNPSGNLFPASQVRRLLEAMPGLVVVDEAYAPFTGENCLDWLPDHPNLLIMRTLSKLGLAGLRLGMLVGDPAWIRELEKLRLPYNVNTLSQVSANFALTNDDFLRAQIEDICQQREWLSENLNSLAGIQLWPSQGNFLLLRTLERPAREVFGALLQQGIVVKCLDGSHPLLTDCLRVTVGTAQENQFFLRTLQDVLKH